MTPEPLLVTEEVAELLHVHPKQIYRLLARGLPGRRIGREWRFDRAEVLRWVAGGADVGEPVEPVEPARDGPGPTPPFVAANGDLAIELLLARLNGGGQPMLGFLPADRDGALALLHAGRVLLAGCHGREPEEQIGDARLARIHLVRREVGLVARGRVPDLADLDPARLASRPRTAGIRLHLDTALREAGVDLRRFERAPVWGSHRDVVHAVVRGASRLGLAFRRLATEAYGLMVRASDLGDPRVVRLCEVAQSAAWRRELGEVPGYDPTDSGAVQYHFR